MTRGRCSSRSTTRSSTRLRSYATASGSSPASSTSTRTASCNGRSPAAWRPRCGPPTTATCRAAPTSCGKPVNWLTWVDSDGAGVAFPDVPEPRRGCVSDATGWRLSIVVKCAVFQTTVGFTIRMRWVIGSSLRLAAAVMVAAVVLLGVGIMQLTHASTTTFPEILPPQVQVQTEALGLSATEVEQLITVPLEDEFNGIAFLDHIRSQSVPGLSSI